MNYYLIKEVLTIEDSISFEALQLDTNTKDLTAFTEEVKSKIFNLPFLESPDGLFRLEDLGTAVESLEIIQITESEFTFLNKNFGAVMYPFGNSLILHSISV